MTSFVIFADVKCVSLAVANANLNTTAVIVNSYVYVSCLSGFQFSTGQYSIVTQCQTDRTWRPQMTDCLGEWLCVFG